MGAGRGLRGITACPPGAGELDLCGYFNLTPTPQLLCFVGASSLPNRSDTAPQRVRPGRVLRPPVWAVLPPERRSGEKTAEGTETNPARRRGAHPSTVSLLTRKMLGHHFLH